MQQKLLFDSSCMNYCWSWGGMVFWNLVYTLYFLYIQGGGIGPVWALITQRWLPIERPVICQKF